jgi:hypothetical protein
MFRILSLAIFLTGAAIAAHAADVYRYVDAQGGVHYTDTWVPGSTLIKVDHGPKASEAAVSAHTAPNKTLAAGDRASTDVAKAADERAVKADVAQAQEEQCKQAKENYTKAVASRRIIKSGSTEGQREYLSEADANAYRLQLHDAMQAACGTDTK